MFLFPFWLVLWIMCFFFSWVWLVFLSSHLTPSKHLNCRSIWLVVLMMHPIMSESRPYASVLALTCFHFNYLIWRKIHYSLIWMQNINGTNGLARHKKKEGFSLPLCSKIVEVLQKRKERFHLQTLCVLGHNTKQDSSGNVLPIISGFLVSLPTLAFFLHCWMN